jgi:type IV pilus biogenesis protein CpaD/CtpE
MPQGFKKVAAFSILLMLAGCASTPAPQVKLLPDASCRLPVVTWSADDTPETIDEIRRLASVRAKLCGKKK